MDVSTEEQTSPPVHLGFVESIETVEQLEQVAFRSPNYNHWDGGQLGGCPNWLDPQHIPYGPLRCVHNRNHILSFVCQIYAPVENEELLQQLQLADRVVKVIEPLPPSSQETPPETSPPPRPERAFHRALFVFACAECCLEPAPGNGNTSNNNNKCKPASVRVLRSQLPQDNPYYPKDPEALSYDELNKWKAHQVVSSLPSSSSSCSTSGREPVYLCQVCGLRATYKCPLQNMFFCCQPHQKEYYQYIHRPQQQQKDEPAQFVQELPSLYPIAEIVVEEEPQQQQDGDQEDSVENTATTMGGLSNSEDDDDDKNLEQGDLNRMVMGKSVGGVGGGVTDPVTLAFLERCRREPDQVMRYHRWPLQQSSSQQQEESSSSPPVWWFRQDDQPATNQSSIPPCELCGAPRQFEFQLMPQMLHYLLRHKQQALEDGKDDEDDNDEDWKRTCQAMQITESWMEHAPPEHVPPGLVKAKEEATRRYQQDKLSLGGSTTTAKKKNHNPAQDLDFGVVAIYTCTASCNFSSCSLSATSSDGTILTTTNNKDNDNDDDNCKNTTTCLPNVTNPLNPSLGACREEFAWVQTSL